MTIELGDIQDGDIIFELSKDGWTNEDITVKAVIQNEKFKGYQLQTSLNGEEWQNVDTHTVTTSSDIVYAKITDGQGNDTTFARYSDFKIDKTNPKITSALQSSNITTSGFTLNVGISDEESGLSQVIWYYKLASDSSYSSITDNLDVIGETTKSKVFSNLVNDAYNVYAVVYDKAGNIKETDKMKIKLKFIELGNISGTYNASVSATSISNYSKLTKDNFFFQCSTIEVPEGCYGTMNFTKSYNASSGSFSVARSSITGNGTIAFTGTIYKGSNATLIGSNSGGYTMTFDCTNIKDWPNKTVDDFIFDVTSVEIPFEAEGTINFSKTYDSSKGILTINRERIVGEGVITFKASLYTIEN